MAALAVVPAAFAHHARISGNMDCQGAVSFTASSWQTSSVLAKTHNDVRVYVTQSNGAAVNPALQVGNGQFNSANGFAFSGGFTVPASVNSVRLLVKEIGPWANGVASSNGTNPESSITVLRPTSGCTPPPTDECPNIAGNQSSVPAGLIKDASGNCVTPPPPPDSCPNIEGTQSSVPAGMIKDANGNCVTPPPPPPPPPPPTDECPNIEGNQASVPVGMTKDATGICSTLATPAALVTATPAAVVAKPAVKAAPKVKAKVKAKKKIKKKVVKKKAVVKHQTTAKKAKPRVLPFTP